METTTMTLKEKWDQLKTAQPHIRIRNAAQALGVSEVELLATQCGQTNTNGHSVTRLRPEFQQILGETGALQKVMALTRNNDVVHERKGVYLNPSLDNPHVGLFVGEDIDLRIFFACWSSAFAVTEMSGDKARSSLQFFAKDGEAIHKIYLTHQSNPDTYRYIVEKYRDENQSPVENVSAWDDSETEIPDSEIDATAFRQGWIDLKDTHEFFGLVKKHKLTRTQALRLAPEGNYATRVSNDALRKIMERSAAKELPIMVFVGNKGMIQIHTGTVKKLVDHEGWFNVLDPDFNLHVKEAAITQSWIVRKPTADGVVTALECFDANGKQIIQVFGKRKPGIPELEEWRAVAASVEA